MRKKRFHAALLAGAITAFGLCGCGNGDAKLQEEVSGEFEQTDKGGVVSLTLWGAEEDAKLLDELVEGFKSSYSQQTFEITVEYQGESNCKNALFGRLTDGPDVFTFADDQLRVMVAAGVLAPVKDAGAVRENNIEAACEAASVNGVLYAYPMTADNGYFLYYNKAYLGEEDIGTMDDILRVARANGKKFVMDWSSGCISIVFLGKQGLRLVLAGMVYQMHATGMRLIRRLPGWMLQRECLQLWAAVR